MQMSCFSQNASGKKGRKGRKKWERAGEERGRTEGWEREEERKEETEQDFIWILQVSLKILTQNNANSPQNTFLF